MGRPRIPDSEKMKKPGVALDAQCREILSKIKEYELAVCSTDLAQAQVIRKCIRKAWELYYLPAMAEKREPSEILESQNLVDPMTYQKPTQLKKSKITPTK